MARIDGSYDERLRQRKTTKVNLNYGFFIPHTLQPGETISEDVEVIKIGENEDENASENIAKNEPKNEDENEGYFDADYEDDFDAIKTEEEQPRNIEQFEDRWEGE